jgi:predicted outer membrane repeat protein
VAAIVSANNEVTNPGLDTIVLADGCTYPFSTINNTSTAGPNALPIARSAITIQGSGTIVTRASGAPAMRILQINSSGSVTVDGPTFENGGGISGQGGSIHNAGVLVVDEATFSGNTASTGGAIENTGTLTVTASGFTSNRATSLDGGAIHSTVIANVSGSTFTSNFASRSGAAISNTGTLNVSGSTFTENVGPFGPGGLGGGIQTTGAITVSGSTFVNNSNYRGGGIGVSPTGSASIDGSTFIGNTGDRGGAIANEGTTMNVHGSTFSHNVAVKGGGIRNFGPLVVSDTTFFANTGDFTGGGIANSETMTITHVTFADNVVNNPKGVTSIANLKFPQLTLSAAVRNSVLKSVGGTGCDGGTVFAGSVGNVTWPGATCPGITADPALGPLQDNGGPTPTMVPAAGSPLLDAAVDTHCSSTDQRGVDRPQGSHCDVGAVELVVADTTAPPIPTFTSTPADPGPASASIAFVDAEASVSFACSLDGGVFSACTSPVSLVDLADGSHTFAVRASDPSGNTSDPAVFGWSVDTSAPPSPTFTSIPADPSGSTVSFSFTDTEPSVAFSCSLDGGSFESCTSPIEIEGLIDGSHGFSVRASDLAGNVSDAASFSWTSVDTLAPPPPSFTATPLDPSGTSVTFAFTDQDATVGFECSLDAAPFTPCDSPLQLTELEEGPHAFQVRAVDPAANPSDPITFSWVVDAVAPLPPSFTATPVDPSGPVVSFSFSSVESDVSFVCALDAEPFEACQSPFDLADLPDGVRTFTVKAVDPAGNSSSPASFIWTVDATPPPIPVFTETPVDPSTPSVVFAFDAPESGSTLLCALDQAAFTECSSPMSFEDLGEGAHSFHVQAVDAFGNTSLPATYDWTVVVPDDTPPPAPTFTLVPTDPSPSTVTFDFIDAEAGVSFSCSLDNTAYAACIAPVALGPLASGPHTFSVTATDRAGHPSSPASYSWTVDGSPPTITLLQPMAETLLTSTSIAVSWSGSDNVGLARYEVFEGLGTGGTSSVVQSSLATSYARVGTFGRTYCYHVVAVDVAGNQSSSPTRCMAVPFDDRSSAIVYTGEGAQSSVPQAFGGTVTTLNGAGQQATFAFNGRRLGVIMQKGPSSGMADIFIDGVFARRVDLYSGKQSYAQIVFQQTVTPGDHVLSVVWTGVKNASSSGTSVGLDGIVAITST